MQVAKGTDNPKRYFIHDQMTLPPKQEEKHVGLSFERRRNLKAREPSRNSGKGKVDVMLISTN